MFHVKQFDVVVVGGGHAGVEAAHAAHRLGLSTALITKSKYDLGVMSCNPAIGGLGKGHLVREIDALDGLMARVADRSTIQHRLLNRSKGPAVRGPRAQIDRSVFRQEMASEIAKAGNISVIEGEVLDIIEENGRICGVNVAKLGDIRATSTIITTGTFLGGKIFVGREVVFGGRMGQTSSKALSDRFRGLGLGVGRLKTGTPPRLNSRTINWDALSRQEGDTHPEFLSFMTRKTSLPQIACGVTATNDLTHEIIRNNLHLSAMYGGDIEGVGPRYCPSIEDKVSRFADKSEHQVFLEPEGLNDDTVYPNGISTSLPVDIQESYVRSIRGLEQVEILQPGYAIEYDFLDPKSLEPTLEHSELKGLYFAGQINGTTGYEEAAAQGLVAGLNAGLAAKELPGLSFDRSSSYIGVMIDDLVSRGVTEPYRMFTSRAEFRLKLRIDNADQRLTEIGYSIGCVSEDRWAHYSTKKGRIAAGYHILSRRGFTSHELERVGFSVKHDGQKRTPFELLSLPGVDLADVVKLVESNEIAEFEPSILEQLAIEARYAHLLHRQESEVEALAKDQNLTIPLDFDYERLSGLSNEVKSKLKAHEPKTIAHAARLEGITPAALTRIVIELRRVELSRAHVG
ncbi:tRNA uridine 5-carboxymethylaminomethyl modification enzyme [Poseidonocella pacifica]|uniref:tRNA uridine 5-carboxymethylaminomethyl modification enzyme MnmG n=1 Tax=Poseidonocella pacifica TaxID=871651 RepID=A0A1I0XX49_9RHOB|nr:tRNA uridine-5-carboxymethylaminomethyl(34) synthesis enzyme MnmG [Poseidonocella pacifica]SFB04738.1 tRNA uridine 5-carboxymethylaminomethyl modification enzyme [Poseidonocella pacifica]